ncbi:winged helix-turn-helix transcriptional regulator [Spirosoma knui]
MPQTDLNEDPFDPALIHKALTILSGKWRLYIILLLDKRTLRYSQLSEKLPDISQKVLASELKALAALGVLTRKVYAEVPPRVEYALTEKGQLALPILKEMQKLGKLFNQESTDEQ